MGGDARGVLGVALIDGMCRLVEDLLVVVLAVDQCQWALGCIGGYEFLSQVAENVDTIGAGDSGDAKGGVRVILRP